MKKEKFSRAKKTLCGRVLRRLLGEENGAVAMEYIVIALLVAAAVVALVMVFSGNLRNMLHKTNTLLEGTTVEDVDKAGDAYNEEQEELKKKNETATGAGNKLGGDFSEVQKSPDQN